MSFWMCRLSVVCGCVWVYVLSAFVALITRTPTVFCCLTVGVSGGRLSVWRAVCIICRAICCVSAKHSMTVMDFSAGTAKRSPCMVDRVGLCACTAHPPERNRSAQTMWISSVVWSMELGMWVSCRLM